MVVIHKMNNPIHENNNGIKLRVKNFFEIKINPYISMIYIKKMKKDH